MIADNRLCKWHDLRHAPTSATEATTCERQTIAAFSTKAPEP
jgi:hypothetical protein